MNVILELLNADSHQGGLKTSLVEIPNNFLEIKKDCLNIFNNYNPSDVTNKDHRTYWTKPFGIAKQWSLWNDSGMFDENQSISAKPNNIKNKKFHYDSEFPNLAKFLNSWPSKLNARLNLLSPSSGLNQHEEQIQQKWGDKNTIRVRFHLPIVTDPECLVFLDGEWFQFEEGKIYFFNNGCVHSAKNNSNIDRLHLVWDCLLTTNILRKLQNGKSILSTIIEPVEENYATYSGKFNFLENDIDIIEDII